MNRRRLLLVCFLLAAAGLAVPVAADVPDARLVVSDVTVTPDTPDPGNTTTVEFTIENSAGSASAVALDRVELRDSDRFSATRADAEDLGSLSVGDDVTLELATAFTDTGVKELELHVETETVAGEQVTVTRPVTIVVGGVDAAGIDDDVQVDARTSARPTSRTTGSTSTSAPTRTGCWAATTTTRRTAVRRSSSSR